jgi:hypothetical protein
MTWKLSPEMQNAIRSAVRDSAELKAGTPLMQAHLQDGTEAEWQHACSALTDIILELAAQLGGGTLGITVAYRKANSNWGCCGTNMSAKVAASSLKTVAKQMRKRAEIGA